MKQKYRRRSSFSFYNAAKIILAVLLIILLIKPAMRYFYPVNYMEEIKRHSEAYSLSSHLVMAVISTESKFDKDAVSHRDAKGLMQLRSDTAKWCIEKFSIDAKGRDIYDADLNIEIGCAYLRYLLDKFGSRLPTALAAYNAGEGNVKKWLDSEGGGYELKDIPFTETEAYVDTVLKRLKIYEFLY